MNGNFDRNITTKPVISRVFDKILKLKAKKSTHKKRIVKIAVINSTAISEKNVCTNCMISICIVIFTFMRKED